MKRAETILTNPNVLYKLSNKLIIDFLINKGLVIDDRIINNVYFQYKLFNLFKPLANINITSINYSENILTVDSSMDSYAIIENSEGGLTLTSFNNTNDGDNLFVNIASVCQVFPCNKGIAIVEHRKSSIGNITIGICDNEERLELNFVDSDGLVQYEQVVRLKNSSNNFSLNQNIDISPLLFKEYLDLFSKIRNSENSIYEVKKRDQKDIFKIYEEYNSNNIHNSNVKYFKSNNLLNILDIDKYYSSSNISEFNIYQKLLNYKSQSVDEVIGKILKMICSKCGYVLDINISDCINQFEVDTINNLLGKPKNRSV